MERTIGLACEAMANPGGSEREETVKPLRRVGLPQGRRAVSRECGIGRSDYARRAVAKPIDEW
jgi:hypothetical protein